MLRLYLLRHAKSSWALPGVTDHDRPLNDRGTGDLPLIGQMMNDRAYNPQAVICSTALRTQTTLEGVLSYLASEPVVSTSKDLYASGTDAYLRLINNAPDCETLLVVGHNPMCDEVTRRLAGTGDADAMELANEHFPTGALAVLDFELEEWSQVKYGAGHLVDFVKPRSLSH